MSGTADPSPVQAGSTAYITDAGRLSGPEAQQYPDIDVFQPLGLGNKVGHPTIHEIAYLDQEMREVGGCSFFVVLRAHNYHRVRSSNCHIQSPATDAFCRRCGDKPSGPMPSRWH
jgi:hypothetical protein